MAHKSLLKKPLLIDWSGEVAVLFTQNSSYSQGAKIAKKQFRRLVLAPATTFSSNKKKYLQGTTLLLVRFFWHATTQLDRNFKASIDKIQERVLEQSSNGTTFILT